MLLKGVNDDVETLAALMRGFVEAGIKPYYLHHPDLARGTSHFRIEYREGPGVDAGSCGRGSRAWRSRPMCSTCQAAMAR